MPTFRQGLPVVSSALLIPFYTRVFYCKHLWLGLRLFSDWKRALQASVQSEGIYAAKNSPQPVVDGGGQIWDISTPASLSSAGSIQFPRGPQQEGALDAQTNNLLNNASWIGFLPLPVPLPCHLTSVSLDHL